MFSWMFSWMKHTCTCLLRNVFFFLYFILRDPFCINDTYSFGTFFLSILKSLWCQHELFGVSRKGFGGSFFQSHFVHKIVGFSKVQSPREGFFKIWLEFLCWICFRQKNISNKMFFIFIMNANLFSITCLSLSYSLFLRKI